MGVVHLVPLAAVLGRLQILAVSLVLVVGGWVAGVHQRVSRFTAAPSGRRFRNYDWRLGLILNSVALDLLQPGWAGYNFDLGAVLARWLVLSHNIGLGSFKEMLTWMLLRWQVTENFVFFAVRSVLFVLVMVGLTFSASMLGLLVCSNDKFVECFDREMGETLLSAALH